MRVGPQWRTGRDFEDALAVARTGVVETDWLFSQEVLEALSDVAPDPTDEAVEAARAVWRRVCPLATALRTADVVVFDVGETLVDETRAWTEAARAVDVSPFTLMGVLGALIERGADHRDVWSELGVEPPSPPGITDVDLYPDVVDCLQALRRSGRVVGIAGNQPAGAEAQLRASGIEVDLLASSARWGVEKPGPAFFERLLAESGTPASRVVYIGDRLDNDVLPAQAAGMRAVLLRRGPWGHLHGARYESEAADAHIDSLTEIVEVLRAEPSRPE